MKNACSVYFTLLLTALKSCKPKVKRKLLAPQQCQLFRFRALNEARQQPKGNAGQKKRTDISHAVRNYSGLFLACLWRVAVKPHSVLLPLFYSIRRRWRGPRLDIHTWRNACAARSARSITSRSARPDMLGRLVIDALAAVTKLAC